MRAGAYTVHQSLTGEAAAVLKLSLCLACRRGHAQVTPLHVAYTLLGGASEPPPSSSPSPRLFTTTTTTTVPAYGLLMRACARSSRSHAAHHRALELCFNVALNRLPTGNNAGLGLGNSLAASLSLLQQQPSPTLSNALVAALKRAQANQRRGCVELLQTQPSPQQGLQSQSTQQQQPMVTIKVELDQLIISILDDPSVSRVMREAGFSSAAVKTNLEEESAAMLLGLGNHHGSRWDLQPVSVPAGLDLELGPRAATASSKVAQRPAQFPPLDHLASKQEDGVPMPMCAECAKYYENEASVVRAKAAGTNLALTFFPGWPQADESQKDDLMELKRKWSRLCQLRVHQWNQPTRPCNANATTSSNSNSNPAGLCLSFEEAPTFFHGGGRSRIRRKEVKTTLSLLPDSVETSDDESEGMDEVMARPAAAAKSMDMKKSVPCLWTCELLPPSGDLKRKAESVWMPSESKRRMGGGGLDLNLRCDEDEDVTDDSLDAQQL